MFRREILIFIMLVAMLPFATTRAMASSTDDARQFVDTLGKRVLETINATNTSEDEKQKRLRQLFSDNVDMAWMGRFVLGRGWQQASAQEREQYLQTYQEYLLAHYTTNFADYSGSKYTITDVRDDGKGVMAAHMQINTAGQQQKTEAGYRLHAGENGAFKITDIIIEGVSLITTQRSEFASVLKRGGMSALITSLQKKTQEENNPKSS